MQLHTERCSSPHRDLIVNYDSMPPRIRAQVEAVLVPLLWIVPPWCRTLGIELTTLDGDSMASVNVDEEYRQAWIRLDDGWLAAEPEDQRRYLGHELIHIMLEPMASLGPRLLDAVRDELRDAAFNVLQEQWSRVVESVTCDLDRVLSMIDNQDVKTRRVTR